jgi:hypothetical protein
LAQLAIPTNVTARSGERDRFGNRGGAGAASVDAAVTIGQVLAYASVGGNRHEVKGEELF